MTSRFPVRFRALAVHPHDMTTDATEAELVAASRRGERDAFAELVRRCTNMVDAVAYAATRDRSLSEDIAQDTFVVAWRELERLRDASALRPWLCKIARNLAHKARRRRAHERETVDADRIAVDRTPYDAVREQQVEQLVDTALAKIPEAYREILVLFYYEQQSTKAVAAALGVREDVVHQRLSRGRRQLATVLEHQVEAALERRRSRRDLAACVLAAIALVPGRAHATTKGVTMLKLGGFTVAAATVAITGIAVWPSAEAAPRPIAVHRAMAHKEANKDSKKDALAKPPSAHPSAAATPRAAITSCSDVARHIVTVSLDAFEDAAAEHAEGIRRVASQLEERCRKEAWSQREIACMMAGDFSATIAKCRPAPRAQPVEGPPELVGDDVDIGCAASGAHLGDLMIESTSLDDLDNVAGQVLEDFRELPAQAVEACTRDAWPEDLRRCYAAADRMGQIVACNLRWR